MRIVWDERKQVENIRKHGFDVAVLDAQFFENSEIIPAAGQRRKALGAFSARVLVVIFFVLGTQGLSVISMRPANKKERKQYEQAVARTSPYHR